jgi:ankyrin repeat protein
MRIVAGDATPAELSLWRTYSTCGFHELHSRDFIDSLASHVKRVVSAVRLHDLKGRPELNGEAATVIGQLEAQSGRVPVRVLATGECLRARPHNVFDHLEKTVEGMEALPLLLECGAGNGVLSHRLASALVGFVRVTACDSGHDRIDASAGAALVARLGSEAAIARYHPAVVLISWMPSGVDWTCHCRGCAEVSQYILLGERDGSICGDEWATWGVLPEDGYEYGLDEDSPKPYTADGFVQTELEEVQQWQICRFDSAMARGFSSAVAFTRIEHSERMLKAAELEHGLEAIAARTLSAPFSAGTEPTGHTTSDNALLAAGVSTFARAALNSPILKVTSGRSGQKKSKSKTKYSKPPPSATTDVRDSGDLGRESGECTSAVAGIPATASRRSNCTSTRSTASMPAQQDLVRLAKLGASCEIADLLDGGSVDINTSYKMPCGQYACLTTPLSAAVTEGNVETVRLLLSRGANPNIPLQPLATDGSIEDSIPILWMTVGDERINHRLDIVPLLLQAGADINATYRDRTALVQACMDGDAAIAEVLIVAGADARAMDLKGRTAMDIAVATGHTNLYDRLVALGVAPSLYKKGQQLIDAAHKGNCDMLRTLLDSTPEKLVDYLDQQRNPGTALTAAAEEDHIDAVRLLLSRGADPDLNMTRETPGKISRVTGVVHQRENSGTALIFAALAGNTAMVQLLVQHGASLDLIGSAGLTAYATCRIYATARHAECARELIRAGCDTTTRDHLGNTPQQRPTLGQTLHARTPAPLDRFVEGEPVTIHGLKAAPQHNGQRGVVLRFDATKERYAVELTGKDKTAGTINLKPANLKPRHTQRKCSNCQRLALPPARKYKVCPCRLVCYCGTACSKEHWKAHHKHVCPGAPKTADAFGKDDPNPGEQKFDGAAWGQHLATQLDAASLNQMSPEAIERLAEFKKAHPREGDPDQRLGSYSKAAVAHNERQQEHDAAFWKAFDDAGSMT